MQINYTLMNNQINEIAKECGFYIDPLNSKVTQKEVEFLCEQIVKECVAVVRKISAINAHSEHKVDVAYSLEKHFGVE